MKTIVLLSALTLGATTSAALADMPRPAKAAPLELSASQMDAVTAGTAGAVVVSTAYAVGDSTVTSTRTRTVAHGGKKVDIAVGTGISRALACCGSGTDAGAQTIVGGSGSQVFGRTHDIQNSNDHISVAISVGSVVAIDR
jgi:opacity protein-like surface antigen